QLFRLLVLEHLEGGPPDCARRLRIKSSLEDKGQTSSILPDFQRSSCGRHTREISKEGGAFTVLVRPRRPLVMVRTIMVSRSDAPEFSSELELTPLVWSSLADLGRGRIGATFRSTTAVRRSYA